MGSKLEEISTSPSASSAVERRAHQRVPCHGKVELRRLPPSPAESIFGKLKNVSQGGCFLETERPLVPGERLVMQISFDSLELRLIGEVRSAKTDPICWAGLELVGMSAEGLQRLKALIEVCASEQVSPAEPAK